MDNQHPPFTVAEYFAGIGLVRMGLQSAGWQVVFANDISSKKFEMYEAFFPDAEAHYVVADIFDIDPQRIPLTTLATCSFPCIDLSVAGNMSGMIKGSHSSAFWGFAKILKAQGDSAPPFILIENVPGWLNSNRGLDFRLTVQTLNEIGYACDVFALNALRFTPQSRLRIFLIGARKLTASRGSAELILTRSNALLPDQLKRNIVANKDLRWLYNEIPEPPPLRSAGLSEIIEPLDESSRLWWTQEEVQRHLAMMNETHRRRVERLVNSRAFVYRAFFRRRRDGRQRVEVRNDDLAGCLRTAVGGSAKQFLIRAGQGELRMRAMTPREYARLQGVPDEYPITVNCVQALTGFGDAVCVPAISWIAESVLSPLAKDELRRGEFPATQLFLFDYDRQPQP
jgi:DNA (cytosine-5)-methyltransferase 1|uniref:DNA (cytosine-5-)-methyltransferase n=1 Tax=Desulfomonile tiedjei TaxID=2358 RepID=A0A7C4AQE6_9BACT